MVKQALHRLTPALHDRLVQLRSSPAMRRISGAGNRRLLARRLAAGAPVTIDVCGSMGFGATLTHVVQLHSHFDGRGPGAGHGTAPGVSIVARNPLYTTPAEPDLLSLYFDRRDPPPDPQAERLRFRFRQDVSLGPIAPALTVAEANRIFLRHYALRPADLAAARSYLDGIGQPCVGVHFRGSDKRLEAARVDWDRTARATAAVMARLGLDHILVATDEAPFIAFMQDRFGAARVFNSECRHLAQGSVPAHFAGGDPVETGREALLTILLLSMCAACVRGNSYLSAWSKILNPALPIVSLNPPYASEVTFPETEIHAGYLQGPLAGLAGEP